MEENRDYAILTNILTQAWSGKTVRQYKEHKGLKKQNLRDNMTSTELILNMLAEASTKDISQANNPKSFDESKNIAREGGNVARVARRELEKRIGRSVISSENAASLRNHTLTQNKENEL